VTLNLGTVLTTGSAKGYSVASGLGGADWVKGIENITGSKYKDTLTGNSSANTLNGGLGKDTLTGGKGADKFVFDTALSSGNVDTITDFAKGSDKLVLDDDIFKAFAAKSSSQLASLLKPTVVDNVAKLSTTNGYLTYVTGIDTLYYDSTGNGSGDIAFVKIELAGNTAPSASDFQVIA
jgi:Ca2+-binding RTX toxin-like protein